MKNKLTFLGHGSLKLTTIDGVVVYIDPAFPGDWYSEAADLILISHHHGDHDRVDLVERKADCVIWDNKDMIRNGEYQTKEFRGLIVRAVPAYNKNHKKEESVGFVITVDDKKIYLSGDTSKINEMADLAKLEIDYSLMPIDGHYNMGPQEAQDCAELIKTKCFIPIHNDPRSMQDGKEYDTGLKQLNSPKVRILHHGESIEI